MSALDELAAAGVAAYRGMCVRAGIDADADLTEARLAHGAESWLWIVARLLHAHDHLDDPTAGWEPAEAIGGAPSAAFNPDRVPHVGALIAAHGPANNAYTVATYTQNPVLLTALVRHSNDGVIGVALRNRYLPLDDTLFDLGGPARIELAQRLSLPEHWVVRLAADPDPAVRVEIAHRAHASSELLDRLATDADARVREAAGKHPSMRPATLRRLLADPNRLVAAAATDTIAYQAQQRRRRAA